MVLDGARRGDLRERGDFTGALFTGDLRGFAVTDILVGDFTGDAAAVGVRTRGVLGFGKPTVPVEVLVLVRLSQPVAVAADAVLVLVLVGEDFKDDDLVGD